MLKLALFAVLLASVALEINGVPDHTGHDHHDHDHDHDHDRDNVLDHMGVPDPKVMVQVYYESLCPDSVKFFKEQMTINNYDSFSPYTSFQFIPFGPVGKATQWYENGTYHFKCHHGETECYGNIVQACALNELQTDEDKFHVVNCLMDLDNLKTVTNDTYPIDKCIKKYDLKSDILNTCVNGNNGLKFLSEMGNKTADVKPRIEGVPTVIVNRGVDKEAVSNLKGAICGHLKPKNLKICSNGTSALAASALIIALASILRSFVVC